MTLSAETRNGRLKIQEFTVNGAISGKGPFAVTHGSTTLEMTRDELKNLAHYSVGHPDRDQIVQHAFGGRELTIKDTEESITITEKIGRLKKEIRIMHYSVKNLHWCIYQFLFTMDFFGRLTPEGKAGLFRTLGMMIYHDMVDPTMAIALSRALDFPDYVSHLNHGSRNPCSADAIPNRESLQGMLAILPPCQVDE